MREYAGQIKRRDKTESSAVLCIVTDRGDRVLDNLTDEILAREWSRSVPVYWTAGGSIYQDFSPPN